MRVCSCWSYSPAALVSHHQQQQAATSARAPAISATAHHTRALAGRPGGLNGEVRAGRPARSMRAPSPPAPPRPARRRPRAPPSPQTLSRVSTERTDRWPPLIDWSRSFAEYVLGQHRRRGLRILLGTLWRTQTWRTLLYDKLHSHVRADECSNILASCSFLIYKIDFNKK